nr:hypothetical protein [Candidatus Sigynarchaeota archaeon]
MGLSLGDAAYFNLKNLKLSLELGLPPLQAEEPPGGREGEQASGSAERVLLRGGGTLRVPRTRRSRVRKHMVQDGNATRLQKGGGARGGGLHHVLHPQPHHPNPPGGGGALHRRREPPAGARPAGAVNKPRGEQDGARPSGAKAETPKPHHTQPHAKSPRTRGHGRTKATKANQKPKKQELWDNL